MIVTSQIAAQLSPGELANAHADLEGLFNCTKCHVLGQKVSQTKCLECHKLLKKRIVNQLGYHASTKVKGQDCTSCHSDHHGKKFNMIRFDKESFNHDLTGYELKGAHQKQDCQACHKSENITSTAIRQKEYTYLGLESSCLFCHKDQHQGTLSENCTDCHGFESFTPASNFDHDQTDFQLIGQHQQVDCRECHQEETRNGSEFQAFADVPFDNCTSCHEDVHQNRFGQNCTQCHTEQSFQAFNGNNNFDHSQTRFKLAGKHRRVDCFVCHKQTAINGSPFQEFVALQSFNCINCHNDVHEQKFGTNCSECHTEQSFRKLKSSHEFDHNMTEFPLEGKHLEVDCKSCHQASTLESIVHTQCATCHEDYHENQFVTVSNTPDCAECHQVIGFEETLFSIDDHQKSIFPLTGAHQATPCFSCHQTEEKWSFREIGQDCKDCHEDIHVGTIDTKYYPDQTCENCHSTNLWAEVNFDHDQTNFALAGVHLQIDCNACHLNESIGMTEQIFAELPSDCIKCHDNVHQDQFEVMGKTDCQRCHGFENWEATYFNHNNAAFKLDGKHENLACAACHKETEENNVSYILYKIEKFACANCHM